MDIKNHLIFIKNGEKTDQIEYCQDRNGKWKVKYHNSSKVYTYKYESIRWYRKQTIINPEIYIIYHNNEPVSGGEQIIDFGDYLRIIFKNDYQKVYKKSSLVIEETYLNGQAARDSFDYLKKLSVHIGVKGDDSISFLSRQYHKIRKISPRSALAVYLGRKPLKSKEVEPDQAIFPFGFNLSQKEATNKALNNQISVIEGPPGTGKTQTILNIIANAIMNKQTVAVVSNNNSATANVIEKLEQYDVDFIGAFLGNKANKDKFFADQTGKYPNMLNWELPDIEIKTIKENIVASQRKLDQMLGYQNKRAILKQELASLQTENKYFNEYNKLPNGKTSKLNSFRSIKADTILAILLGYQRSVKDGKLPLTRKLYNLFAYGIYGFKFYENTPEEIMGSLQQMYYSKKSQELEKEIDQLLSHLSGYQFDREIKLASENAMKVFKAMLVKRFNMNSRRPVFAEDILWKNTTRFVKEYPVILSTTHSLRSCASANFMFDYLIIDEASQVDLLSGALALSCGEKAVIVGDLKQLPNVVTSKDAQIAEQIFQSYKLNRAYSYVKHSLLSSMVDLCSDIPRTVLKEHYRCHPKIIGFCNQKYYNNQLIILTDEKTDDKPLLVYKTAKGNHARGNFNQRQIDVIFEEILSQQKIDPESQSLGIVSPYRLQTDTLQETIGSRNIEADTVHKYQGREKDVIILTTVANKVKANDFVDNPNLINVAVSRAVNQLILVVSEGSEKWDDTNIGDLVRYIKYNNFDVIESQIYSVFDLLYQSYSDKLLEFIRTNKRVSEYESENLMNRLIEKVLSDPKYQHLGRVMHQPLRMLIKDTSKLNPDEYKFAMNVLTHTDFVIFHKVDKRPVLVVEVDGYAYHANNPKQLKRDRMKDDILAKYGIPILRLGTNESGEESRLRQALLER